MFKGLKRKHLLWLVGQLQFWTFWRGGSTTGNFNALRLFQMGDGRYGVWAPVLSFLLRNIHVWVICMEFDGSHLSFPKFFPLCRLDIRKIWEYRFPKAAGSYPTSASLRLSVGYCSDVFRTSVASKTCIFTGFACFSLVWHPCCVPWQAPIGHWCCMLQC